MSYCPLMSYAKQYTTGVECFREECGFADAAGNCLIQQALQYYVEKERTRIVTETEAARNHFEMLHKNGMRTPIDFKQHTQNSIEIDLKEWERD